ncbi:MAG TPA: SAV_915 family protein [Sporichthyaceae bacterium]|jgi:hypothetical protein|nr:SAV_915 family protein [Sporichthyaceae bacterium]
MPNDPTAPGRSVAPTPLFVPVRYRSQSLSLRLFATRMGGRTAVAFSTRERLLGLLGPGQAWVRLTDAAVRGLTRPIGVTELMVDPVLIAAPPGPGRGKTIAAVAEVCVVPAVPGDAAVVA